MKSGGRGEGGFGASGEEAAPGGEISCRDYGAMSGAGMRGGYWSAQRVHYKRHRVFLRCANVSAVMLDGVSKRYCQQCGKYLSSNISITSVCCQKGGTKSSDHQLLKICVPQTKMNLFGPAFIEVENESGLSNFIPICEEMEILLQKFDATLSSQEHQLSCLRPECEVLALRRVRFSEFVLDVGWLLRNPISRQPSASSSVLRFNHLLEFLIEKESSVILERVFCSLKSMMDNNPVSGISDADMSLLQKNMDTAQNVLYLKLQENDFWVVHRAVENIFMGSHQMKACRVSSSVEPRRGHESQSSGKADKILQPPSKLPRQPLIMAIGAIGVCFGVCVVVLHHTRVVQIAMTGQEHNNIQLTKASYSEDHRIVQAMTEIIPGLKGELSAKLQQGRSICHWEV